MTTTMETNRSTAKANPNVASVLNRQIANWTVLYVKLHQFHWFVKGTQFFTLHAKFEELYNEAATHIDELAERVLSVGGRPIATMRECMAEASVKEAAGTEKASEMVRAVEQDFRTIVRELREGMEAAQGAGDETTSDMLLAICTSLEKHIWMLASYND